MTLSSDVLCCKHIPFQLHIAPIFPAGASGKGNGQTIRNTLCFLYLNQPTRKWEPIGHLETVSVFHI